MRSFVLVAATFLIVATAAFSQKSALSASTGEVSRKDEQQIRQLEAEMLKGEMNSDPVVFENILADDCLMLRAMLRRLSASGNFIRTGESRPIPKSSLLTSV